MQNAGKVKFDPPKVPVIFVLGKFRRMNLFDAYKGSTEVTVSIMMKGKIVSTP